MSRKKVIKDGDIEREVNVIEFKNPEERVPEPPTVLTGKVTEKMAEVFKEVFPTGVIKTAESFLISKGIDPPIKQSPIQNITFIQLCELLDEFRNG